MTDKIRISYNGSYKDKHCIVYSMVSNGNKA